MRFANRFLCSSSGKSLAIYAFVVILAEDALRVLYLPVLGTSLKSLTLRYFRLTTRLLKQNVDKIQFIFDALFYTNDMKILVNSSQLPTILSDLNL